MVAVVVGIGLIVGMGILNEAAYTAAGAKLIDQLGNAPYYGGPIVLVLGIVAIVLRWRIPHIVARPPGSRATQIAVLSIVLTLSAAVLSAVLIVIMVVSEALILCSTAGC